MRRIINETNEATSTYRVVENWGLLGHKTGVLAWEVSANVVLTVWLPTDDAADDTADTNWVDSTLLLTGSASITNDSDTALWDTAVRASKIMFKRIVSNATNSTIVSLDAYQT